MTTKRTTITLPWLVRITLVLANIVIILGATLAYCEYKKNRDEFSMQLNQSIGEVKTKNAIEAIERTYTAEFMKAMALLKSNRNDSTDEFIDAKNLILNTYYLIAVIYQNEIADNDIIRSSIKTEFLTYINSKHFRDVPETSPTKIKILEIANNF